MAALEPPVEALVPPVVALEPPVEALVPPVAAMPPVEALVPPVVALEPPVEALLPPVAGAPPVALVAELELVIVEPPVFLVEVTGAPPVLLAAFDVPPELGAVVPMTPPLADAFESCSGPAVAEPEAPQPAMFTTLAQISVTNIEDGNRTKLSQIRMNFS